MRRLVYSQAAQGDLVGFYEDVTAQMGEMVSEADVQSLLDRCEDLARFPDMGRRRPDFDAMGLEARSLSHGAQVVFYTKRGGTVIVVRVLREG